MPNKHPPKVLPTHGSSFKDQVERLEASGYPQHLLISVSEGIHKKSKSKRLLTNDAHRKQLASKKEKMTMVPYVHRVSHGLKRIGKRVDVRVAVSAPHKLLGLCRVGSSVTKQPRRCQTKHQKPFVDCVEGTVYKIPLSCGKSYVACASTSTV